MPRPPSAGLLLFREAPDLEVLLVHPGGPFWTAKDEHAWSIPKGEFDPSAEDALDAARREFAEELGSPPPDGPYLPLGEIRQSGGKVVTAWAVRGELDPAGVVSNTFSLEWPPRSGRLAEFPEIDRAQWCVPQDAERRLVRAQAEFLGRLRAALDPGGTPAGPGGFQ